MPYCSSCGTFNDDNNFRCTQCSTILQQAPAQHAVQPYGQPHAVDTYGQKSRAAAGLLQIFLGSFGVGRFYLGYTGIGLAQIAVTWLTCGLGGLWPFIDGIMILTGNVPTDADGNPLKE